MALASRVTLQSLTSSSLSGMVLSLMFPLFLSSRVAAVHLGSGITVCAILMTSYILIRKIRISKIEKIAVELYDLNRFFAIFCEFFPKIKLDTGKRLEMTLEMCPFHMSSCVYGFPFRYSGEVKTKTVELYRMTH